MSDTDSPPRAYNSFMYGKHKHKHLYGLQQLHEQQRRKKNKSIKKMRKNFKEAKKRGDKKAHRQILAEFDQLNENKRYKEQKALARARPYRRRKYDGSKPEFESTSASVANHCDSFQSHSRSFCDSRQPQGPPQAQQQQRYPSHHSQTHCDSFQSHSRSFCDSRQPQGPPQAQQQQRYPSHHSQTHCDSFQSHSRSSFDSRQPQGPPQAQHAQQQQRYPSHNSQTHSDSLQCHSRSFLDSRQPQGCTQHNATSLSRCAACNTNREVNNNNKGQQQQEMRPIHPQMSQPMMPHFSVSVAQPVKYNMNEMHAMMANMNAGHGSRQAQHAQQQQRYPSHHSQTHSDSLQSHPRSFFDSRQPQGPPQAQHAQQRQTYPSRHSQTHSDQTMARQSIPLPQSCQVPIFDSVHVAGVSSGGDIDGIGELDVYDYETDESELEEGEIRQRPLHQKQKPKLKRGNKKRNRKLKRRRKEHNGNGQEYNANGKDHYYAQKSDAKHGQLQCPPMKKRRYMETEDYDCDTWSTTAAMDEDDDGWKQ
eukprot:586863_1